MERLKSRDWMVLVLALFALSFTVPAHAAPGAVLDPPPYLLLGRPTFYANSPAGTNYPIIDPATVWLYRRCIPICRPSTGTGPGTKLRGYAQLNAPGGVQPPAQPALSGACNPCAQG